MKEIPKSIIFTIIIILISNGNTYANSAAAPNKFNAVIESKIEIDKQEMQLIEKQTEIEQEILKEYSKQEYTIDKPYLKVNPYDVNPLSAIVIFEAEEPIEATVVVKGKETITKTFTGLDKKVILPILGLYPGTKNEVLLTLKTKNGEKSKTVFIQTDSLPESFPKNKLHVANKEKISHGLTFIFGNSYKVYAIDSNGDVRFLYTEPHIWEMARLKNGNLIISSPFKIPNSTYEVHGLMEVNSLGKIIKYFKIPFGVHHDFKELPSGNLIIATKDSITKHVEDVIVEVDRETGEIVKEWDFKSIIDKGRTGFVGQNDKDWLHINSVFYDQSNNSIIVSGRHQGVIAIDKDSSEIKWILSDHNNWKPEYHKYLLRPIGANFEFPYGQHAATILPNNNLLLYDNGNFRSVDEENFTPAYKNYSRAVEYEIDDRNKTVKQIWQYGKEQGSKLFTPYIGDADFNKDSNSIMITFGAIVSDKYGNPVDDAFLPGLINKTRIVEVERNQEKDVIFDLEEEKGNVYRAERMNLYPDNKVIRLSLGVEGKVLFDKDYFTPKEKYELTKDVGLRIPVRITNLSDISWKEKDSTMISYHILDDNGKTLIWENDRIKIDSLDTKESRFFQVDIPNIPSEKGTYIIQLDIVQEGVAWFSSKGMKTYDIIVEVK